MEAKTNGRVQRSAAEWQQILNRFAESGRSRAAFCRAEGLWLATLDVWQRKLGPKKAAAKAGKKAAREFVEVTPVSEAGVGGWLVEIELPDGWSKGGKTETLLAFMARGARYIGDEWVYIDARGERMHGIPEPIRVWDWHLRQMPELRRAVGARELARLAAVRRVLVLEEHLGHRRGRRLAPVRFLGRTRPLLQRQAGFDIHPRRLFGERLDLSGPLDKIVFVGSHTSPEVTARHIDPADIAARMVSLCSTSACPSWRSTTCSVSPSRRHATR